MPKTLSPEHIKAMQAGRKRAIKERPKCLMKIETKIDMLGKDHKRETDPHKRAEILREIQQLGRERSRLQRGD